MDHLHFLALIASGLCGAHAAAAAFQDKSLGLLRNSLAGLAGSGLGAAGLVLTLGMGEGTSGLLQSIAGGGLGGALLVYLIGTARGLGRR